MSALKQTTNVRHSIRQALPKVVYAYGFSFRKRVILRHFAVPSSVRFISILSRLPIGGTLLLWGSTTPPTPLPMGTRVVRVEDGFLRSVGLGADLKSPLSWVLDQTGMYYDASAPSDLERFLSSKDFTEAELSRAAALCERIVSTGLTKYNLQGGDEWQRPVADQRAILVPGQVETDASIRLGTGDVARNMDLLRNVRAANPDAYIVYKPHPDVVAGLRHAGCGESEAEHWCDEIVIDKGIGSLIAAVDEVHVLTSLTGFEALMRSKRVVCYGLPFYAGWGLTSDKIGSPRRGRPVGLEALIYAALIWYPTYVARGFPFNLITPEEALDQLLQWRERAPRELTTAHLLFQRIWRRVGRRP